MLGQYAGERRRYSIGDLERLVGSNTRENEAVRESLDASRFADRNRPIQSGVYRQCPVTRNQRPRNAVSLESPVGERSLSWLYRPDFLDHTT